MTIFWILWGIDLVIALVVLYFFFTGLADGSVSSFNGGLWFGMLVAVAIVIFGSLALKSHDYMRTAYSLLALMAFPGVMYGLMVLIMIFGKGRMN